MKIFLKSWIFLLSLLIIFSCGGKEERKQSFFNKGMELFEKGDYKKAQLEFKNAIKIDPKFAKGYYMVGLCAYRLRNLTQAFKYFNTATTLDPTLFDAHIKMGFIYIIAREPEKALEKAELVLKKEAKNTEALLLKATALKFQNKKEEAIKILKEIISLDPKKAQAYISLAQLYEVKNDLALAEETLKTGLKNNPKNLSLNLALASFYESQKRFKEAEAFYKKAIGLSKEDRAKLILVRFYTRISEFDKAKEITNYLIKAHPEDYKYHLTLAAILLKEKKITEAEKTLKKAIETFNEPEIYLFLADLYKQQGKEKPYLDILKQCVKSAKESPLLFKARNLLATYYLEKGENKLAFDEINAVLEKNPKNLEAHFLKAKYHLNMKQANEAIAELRFVLKERPKFLDAYRLLARAYFMNGQIELAEDTLKEALKIKEDDLESKFLLAQVYFKKHDLKEAEREFEEILKIAPNHIPTLILLGDTYLIQGKIEKSKKVYNKALNLSPKNPFIYHKLGIIEKSQKNFDKAINHFKEALKIKKDFLEALIELTRCYVAKKEYQKAIAKCKEYLNLVPKHEFYIQNLLGEVYLRAKKPKKAEEAFLKAISIKPEAPNTYYNLARVYKYLFPKETAKNYEKIIKTELKDSPHAWFILALLYEQEGKYKKVESCYQYILNKYPEHAAAANNLAFLYVEKMKTDENLKKARNLIDKVIKKFPNHPDFLDTSGWIHYHLKNYEKALSDLREAIRINPDKPIYHYHLGMTYKAMGQLTLAKAELIKVTKENINFPGKSLALKTLQEITQKIK